MNIIEENKIFGAMEIGPMVTNIPVVGVDTKDGALPIASAAVTYQFNFKLKSTLSEFLFIRIDLKDNDYGFPDEGKLRVTSERDRIDEELSYSVGSNILSTAPLSKFITRGRPLTIALELVNPARAMVS